MSGGGGGTNTVTQSSQPPAQFQAALGNSLTADQSAASAPLQQYPAGPNASNIVAPLNATQNQAFSEINNAQGAAQPYINQADQAIQASTAPLWSGVQQFSPQAVQQYESPYTSDVVNSTQAEFNNQNAQQQQSIAGNAVSAGAWGGDRAGVAQGIAAGQEQLAQAPVIAGLENQGYSQALGEFNNQQSTQLGANEANSWLDSQAGANLANLGAENLSTQLSGANAELQSGGLQQQETQQQLNVPYEQFLQQQAYPFQTSGWLTGETEGLSSTAGGTGTSTGASNPSPLSEIGGLATTGIGAAGLANTLGLFGSGAADYSGVAAGASALSDAGADAAIAGGIDAGASDAAAIGATALLAKRGGALPNRRAGGGVSAFDDGGSIDKLEELDELGPGWAVGGTVPGAPVAVPTNSGLSPMGSSVPDVSGGIVPASPAPAGRGMSLPHPTASTASPQGANPVQTLSMAKQLGVFGKPGGSSDSDDGYRKGGGIAAFADGGDAPFTDDIQQQIGDMPTDATDGQISLPGGNPAMEASGLTAGANVAPAPSQGPSGVAAASRIDPSGVAASLNSGYAADYKPSTIDPQRAEDIRKQAPWLALLSAGAGMLGGHSTNGVANIGEGLQQGLQTYAGQIGAANQLEAKQTEQQNTGNYQKATLDMDARRLSDAADEARKKLQQADTDTTNTQAFRTSQLENEKTRLGIEQQQANLAAIPPDVRTAQWLASATPEQQAAYQESFTAKNPLLAAGANRSPGTPLPPAMEAKAQAIAHDLAAPYPSGTRAPEALPIMQRAGEITPGYDSADWPTKVKGLENWNQGADAKIVGAISNGVGHLETLRQMQTALNNGDTQTFNSLSNWFAKQTGATAPTNLDTARNIVGGEIIKGIVGAVSGEKERDAARDTFGPMLAPAQANGNIDTTEQLLSSQLETQRQRYQTATKRNDFDARLSPQARDILNKYSASNQPPSAGQGAAAAAQPGSKPAAAPAPTIPTGITPDMIQAEIARRAAARTQPPAP